MYATDFRNCTIMHGFLLSDTHIGFLSSETAILSQNRTVRSDSGPVCLTGRLSVDQREFRRRGTQCTKTLWPLVWERTVCYWNDTPHTAQLNVKRITHTHTHTGEIRTSTFTQNMNDVSPAWLHDAGAAGQTAMTKLWRFHESPHFYCGSS